MTHYEIATQLLQRSDNLGDVVPFEHRIPPSEALVGEATAHALLAIADLLERIGEHLHRVEENLDEHLRRPLLTDRPPPPYAFPGTT